MGPTRRRASIGSIALACLAVATAGCSRAQSKADFLADADAACKPANAVVADFTTPTDLPGLREFGIKLADAIDETTAKLDKLTFPDGEDGEGAKALVKAMRDGAAALRAVGPAVDKEHYTDIETAARKAVDVVGVADSRARAYGSTECGRGEAEAAGRMANALGATVKSAFVVKVDALCTRALDESKALPAPESHQEAVAHLDKVIALYEKLATDAKAVAPPLTDKDKLEAWLAAQDAVVTKARELRTAVAAGDEDRVEALTGETRNRMLATVGKASAYGFKACGTGPS